MEKRSSRRSVVLEQPQPVLAEPATKRGRPTKRQTKQVGVPTIIEESPQKNAPTTTTTATNANKIMKEPSLVLRKLSPTSLVQKATTPVAITTKRSTRASAATPPITKKIPERILEKEERISPSRQSTISSVSTAPTVDLTAATEAGDMPNTATARLNDFIRRSASLTIEAATNPIRRSLSRAPSVGSSVAETVSRYTRSRSRSHYEDEEEEYSDMEEQGKYYSVKSEQFDSTQSFTCRPATIPSEFGGPFLQFLLLIFVPLSTIYLVLSAGKFTPQLPKDNDYLKLIKNTFPTDVVLVYLGFQFSLFILSGILPGTKISLQHDWTVKWTFNALPLAVVTNLALFALAYYGKFNVFNFVLRNEWRLCIMGLLHAYVTAFWAVVRAKYGKTEKEQLNVYGKSGNLITDFALGHLINPKAFNFINYKQYAYRAQLITTLIIAQCYFFKHVNWPDATGLSTDLLELGPQLLKMLNLNSAAFCTGILLLSYALDNIIFEHHLLSSFELHGEGFGCLTLLRYAATPYLLSGFLRYSHKQKVLLNGNLPFVAALLLLCVGWIIKRFSSAIKHKYRVSPTSPVFYKVDTIHTYQGRRLLLGAFWGRLRQPNYAGDILALIALGLPLALNNIWKPYLCILPIILTLLHRAVRVNERNRQVYYSSWVRYCQQVRYYIVPKIF